MGNKLIIPLILLGTVAGSWGGWESETVSSEGDVGESCYLAVDRWRRPHITYVDKTQGKVMYARYDGSRWEFETVASDVDVRGNTALAFDAFDNPHVIFQDEKAGELNYAYRSGTDWVTENVEEGAGYGVYVSVTAWPTGPRVAYTAPVGMDTRLKYGYRDNGSWETENVIGGGGGLFNSLIIDAEAASHTIYSYFTGTELIVVHAVREDTSWETDTITKGIDCHAILGPEGKIHVSLAEENNTGLVYAVSNGSGWTTEKIAEAAGSPAYTHVCVNGRGDVFVSYFNFEEHDLRIVTKEGGTWTHEVVATGAYVGLPHSMALGNDGYPLIAYYDSDNGDLKLAHYDPLSDIELRFFKAERVASGVDIRWRVGNAANVAGFNIYRAGRESEREKINRKLIRGASPFEYHDGTAAPSAAYEYWLEAVSMTGKTRVYGPTSAPPSAKAAAFMLHQNTPNPWRGTTTFAFELPEGTEITLAVYDISGRKVADVAKGYYGAGRHVVPFERTLVPGVYVYRLDAGRETAARRTVVIK